MCDVLLCKISNLDHILIILCSSHSKYLSTDVKAYGHEYKSIRTGELIYLMLISKLKYGTINIQNLDLMGTGLSFLR